jgi:hypothetical protein
MRKYRSTGTISPFTKRPGPDGKLHEGWCAVFEGECCSCDDDDRRRRTRRPRPLSGGEVQQPQNELEEA